MTEEITSPVAGVTENYKLSEVGHRNELCSLYSTESILTLGSFVFKPKLILKLSSISLCKYKAVDKLCFRLHRFNGIHLVKSSDESMKGKTYI